MEIDLKEHEKKVKRTWHFGWVPKHTEVFETNFDVKVLLHLIDEIFEKIDWHTVFIGDDSIEAKRFNSWGALTESIVISCDTRGKVTVTSKTAQGHFTDFGANSKRVRTFISIFHAYISTYDENKIKEIRKEIDDLENMTNYVVPETLPPPAPYKEPEYKYFVGGYLLTALLCGYLSSILAIHFTYVPIMYELGIGFLFGMVTKFILKISNFTEYPKIKAVLIVSIILTLFTHEYFIYLDVLSNVPGINFGDYIIPKIKYGLQIDKFNLGSAAVIVAWIIQIAVTSLFGLAFIQSKIISYITGRVPMEVLEYVIYLLTKDKSEQEIENALIEKGWTDTRNIDEIYFTLKSMAADLETFRE